MIYYPLKIIFMLRPALICQKIIYSKELNPSKHIKRLWHTSRCFSAEERVPVEFTRNFCIIAHVDHGKSTLADRFLEITGAITESEENKQVLDRLPVEKERGITVKAVSASLNYIHKGIKYQLNLIDTPGHVDFSNEVSRSLVACQGVILLVDANEGIQAQTVANYHLAVAKKLRILPVLNKIDLKHADPQRVEAEMNVILGIDSSEVSHISAKTGLGVEDLLVSIIEKVPPPKVEPDGPFTGLVIDSWYDNFRGSVLFIYIRSGILKLGDWICSYHTGQSYQIKSLAKLCPQELEVSTLYCGQVGALSCNMRNSKEAIVGDTIFAKGESITDPEVLETSKPKVFAGFFAKSQSEYSALKSAIEKLLMNDPAVSVTTENSPALGAGWRLGFMGLLHLDVFRQRLEQEFDKETVLTAPSVTYKCKIIGSKNIKKFGGEEIFLRNPVDFPDLSIVKEMYEPVILATIITPAECMDVVVEECVSRRGEEQQCISLSSNRVMLKFLIPLSEIVLDFHDKLKSLTSGYASFDYVDRGYVPAPLQKLTFLINGKEVEELTTIVHASRAYECGRRIAAKLKDYIPRQQVLITIQASVQGKILAREDIKPYRKDVTAKLYGGDSTRKTKLLRAQKEGKKKMRQFANIQIPRDTFIDVLREY